MVKNVVADALSLQPYVSVVTIAYHDELEVMKDQYTEDEQFAGICEWIAA